MKANGMIITCMARESILGVMVESMKVNMLVTRNMAMASIIGPMDVDMKGCGKTANKMVRGNICFLMALLRSVSGTMVRGSGG
jgi:hypothetical protein